MTDMKKNRKQQKGGAYPIIPPPMMPAPAFVGVPAPRVAAPAFMGPITPPTMLRLPTQSTLLPTFPAGPTVHYSRGRRIMHPTFPIAASYPYFFVRNISRNDPYFILVVRYKFQAVADKCYAFFKLDSRSPTFTTFQCGGYCAIQRENTSLISMTEDQRKEQKRTDVQNFFNTSVSGKGEPLTAPPELLGRMHPWNVDIFVGEVDLSAAAPGGKPRPANTTEVVYLTASEIYTSPVAVTLAEKSKAIARAVIKQKP